MLVSPRLERRIRQRIELSLRDMVDIEFQTMEDGNYRIVRGSAVIYLTLTPWGARDMIMRCTSYVVVGATIDSDLLAFLLWANSRMTFGAFAIDDDQDILFEYTLIASNASIFELKEAVKSVAKAVDDYDNKIINRWGGRTSFAVVFGYDPD